MPSERYVITNAEGSIVLTEVEPPYQELVAVIASDRDAIAKAQKTIHKLVELGDEDRCFAHFWFGYFYAHMG